MIPASQIRWGLMILMLGVMHSFCVAQGRTVGVGVDGLLWAGGWTNAQVSVCLTDELRVQCGVGALRGADSPVSALLRPRPGVFDRAGLVSFGLRATPGMVDGRPFRAIIGMEWAAETFVKTASAEFGTLGLMKWSRRDLRILAGAEWVCSSGWGLACHAGVGHSGTAGEGFDPDLSRKVQNGPSLARMFGLEIKKWF